MQKSTLESYKMPRSRCFDELLLLKVIVQHDRSISSTPSHHALDNISHSTPSAALSTPHSPILRGCARSEKMTFSSESRFRLLGQGSAQLRVME